MKARSAPASKEKAMPAANDNVPRLLTQKQAAAYCGTSATTFAKWVLAGAVPASLPTTRRWDRRAIDMHLDQLSGLGETRAEEDPLATWRRERDAAKVARGR